MSDTAAAPEPLKKFSYPFQRTDTSSPTQPRSTDVVDPQTYYDALAQAEDGFFPIGYNGQWHGGIHFGAQTGATLAQDDGIRCIADGEVIAWKIDDAYPTVEYATCGAATYSTGFVLVRHRLQLPEADRVSDDDVDTGGAADGTQGETEEEPSLVFYSLYIHLLDWKGYQADADKARPALWGKPIYLVGENANDADRTRNPHIPEGGVGLNVRNAANGILGFAPRGTQLRLGARRGTSSYYSVEEVVSGALVPPGLADAYVFRDELTAMPVEPPSKGEIVIPDTPVAILAGDLVGHLGQYQRYIDMNPLGSSCNERELMQVDVFATEDLEAFITQSRARAAELADRHKTLLLVDRGARLVQVPGSNGSPTGAQLAAGAGNADGPETAHPRVIPIKALGEAVTEEDGTRWWNVEVGTDAGGRESGWVRERDHANVKLCTPWDWPGFEIVKIDETRPDQFYANQIVRQGHAAAAEQGDLEQRGRNAEMGPLFRKLYDLIDLDDDKKIVSSEIRQALAKPWLAQAISHLIVRHESEWSGPMDKWSTIDELIPDQRKKDWEKEKERIESLLWWSEAKGKHGLPESEPLIAYNFHPVGLIGTFNVRNTRITVEMLQQIFTTAPADRLRAIVNEVNENIEDYKLDSSLRLSHFFAQVREEVGNSASFTESLNYSPSGLIATFSYFARNPNEAQAYGRANGQIADQEAIANRAYGSRNGNGSIASGDGWRYRGRGLKMTTGRGNYQDLQDNYHLVWPGNAPDFVGDPELLGRARYAVQSAVFFWIRHNLYQIADQGPTDANVDSITRIINRHTNSYAARRNHFSNINTADVFATIDE